VIAISQRRMDIEYCLEIFPGIREGSVALRVCWFYGCSGLHTCAW